MPSLLAGSQYPTELLFLKAEQRYSLPTIYIPLRTVLIKNCDVNLNLCMNLLESLLSPFESLSGALKGPQ